MKNIMDKSKVEELLLSAENFFNSNCAIQEQIFNFCFFTDAFNKISEVLLASMDNLENQEALTMESYVLSRMLYKMNNQWRREKSLQGLKRVGIYNTSEINEKGTRFKSGYYNNKPHHLFKFSILAVLLRTCKHFSPL